MKTAFAKETSPNGCVASRASKLRSCATLAVGPGPWFFQKLQVVLKSSGSAVEVEVQKDGVCVYRVFMVQSEDGRPFSVDSFEGYVLFVQVFGSKNSSL